MQYLQYVCICIMHTSNSQPSLQSPHIHFILVFLNNILVYSAQFVAVVDNGVTHVIVFILLQCLTLSLRVAMLLLGRRLISSGQLSSGSLLAFVLYQKDMLTNMRVSFIIQSIHTILRVSSSVFKLKRFCLFGVLSNWCMSMETF